MSECSDGDRDLYPQRTVCFVTMATMAANRAYEAAHEDRPWHDGSFTHWAKDRSEATPYRYDDGVTIWVAPVDLTPDDDFLTPPPLPGI